MCNFSVIVVGCLLLCGAATPAVAQRIPDLPLTLEVRLGAGAPTGDFADPAAGVDAEAGFGFEVGARLNVTPTVALYGAYQWMEFGCAECETAEIDGDVLDSGGEIGARADLPFQRAGLAPWVRAGILFHELEFSGEGGSLRSDAAFGFGIGAGVAVPLQRGLTLLPGIHYRTYSADFEFEELSLRNLSTDVSHVTLDVGLAYRF